MTQLNFWSVRFAVVLHCSVAGEDSCACRARSLRAVLLRITVFSSSQSVRKVSVEQPFGVFSRIYRRRWILIVRIPKVVMAADDRRQVFNLFWRRAYVICPITFIVHLILISFEFEKPSMHLNEYNEMPEMYNWCSKRAVGIENMSDANRKEKITERGNQFQYHLLHLLLENKRFPVQLIDIRNDCSFFILRFFLSLPWWIGVISAAMWKK